MTSEQMELVQAAQSYDMAHRPPMASWTKVPDEQVLRLLTGAKLARASTRPCTVADQVRWALAFIKEHYGPGSVYAREHSGE